LSTHLTIHPGIQTVLRSTEGLEPDTFVEAIHRELDPVIEFLSTGEPEADLEQVRWMLMELTANAILARLGRVLVERTGFSRNALLGALGVNPVWGPEDPEAHEFDEADPVLRSIEEVVGCSIREYLRLPLAEKFETLGTHEHPGWVRLRVSFREETGDFEIFVESDGAPLPEDAEEITRRFTDFECVLAEVKAQAKAYRDAQGRVFRPSFTGGGGMGLLACIRTCKVLGLHLDFLPEEGGERRTVFRLASFPRGE
jgi:hypothetical protein